MRIRLSGPVEVRAGDVRLGPSDFPGRQGRIAFAYLALAGRAVDRDELADVLWPDRLPASWARDLSAIVSKLKSLLQPLTQSTPVIGGGRWYELCLPDGASIDVVEATIDLARAEAARQSGDDDGALDAAASAARVLGERFLAGDDCAWIDDQRAAQHDLLVRAVQLRAEVLCDRGDPSALLAARELVALDPHREESHLLVVRAHLGRGDRIGALDAYERLRRMLAEEFGLTPSVAAEALAHEALGREPDGVRPAVDASAAPLPAVLERSRGTPLLGRDTELDHLARSLRRGARSCRVALVAGDAGIGKSRLVAELAHRLHSEGRIVLLGGCETAANEPYGPWIEALERVGEAADAFARALALLRPDETSDSPEPASRLSLFHAVARELGSAARSWSTLLVFEDVHLIDADSRALLEVVVNEEAATTVVLTAREAELGAETERLLTNLRRDDALATMRLEGLPREAVRELVQILAGGRRVAGAVTDAIHAATAGNPLYAREVTRHLEHVGALDGQVGGEVASVLGATGLPDGLAELIDSNIARAGPHVRRVLETAAVIGTTFDTRVLRRACDLPEDALDLALERARRAHLVVGAAGSVHRLRFEHPLVREVLAASSGDDRRAMIHRRVAEAIEVGAGDDLGPHTAELAHHLVAAAGIGTASDALTFAIRAGDRALAVYAYAEAAQWYEQAVALARRDDGDEDRLARALAALGDARNRLGDLAGARGPLAEAAELARELGNGELIAHVTLIAASLLVDDGFEGGTVDYSLVGMLQDAIEALPDGSGSRARLRARLATELHFSGDRDRCERLAIEAESEARAANDVDALASALAARHYAMYGAPDVRRRIELLHELQSLRATVRPDPRWARDHLELGDIEAFDDATARFEYLLERASVASDHYYPAVWRAARAIVAGDLDRAEELAARAAAVGRDAGRGPTAVAGVQAAQTFAIALFRETLAGHADVVDALATSSPDRPAWRAAAAFLHAETGDLAGAIDHYTELRVAGFASLPSTVDLPVTLALLAWVCAEVGDTDDARELTRLLLPYSDLALVIGATAPAVCAGPAAYPLAVLHRRLGDHAAAELWFDRAEAMARRMCSPPWLDRIRRARRPA